ncbi:ASCH domain-containing protein [Phytohabitans suffuscus]
MLFERRLRDGIADGTITAALRRWRRLQVVAGRTYRTGAGLVEVTAADPVQPEDLTPADARSAGFESVDTMLTQLHGPTDGHLYLLRFRRVAGPDPREALAADDRLDDAGLAAIDLRLARLDHASTRGPWTAAVLRAIADRPGVRAADLADVLGRDVPSFKADVRKLKALGLTESLEIGYRLSPRGAAYLAHRP